MHLPGWISNLNKKFWTGQSPTPFVALTFCFWHTFILIDADLLQKGCVHFILVCCPWGCAVWKGLLGYCWQVVQPSCLGFLILNRGSRLPGCRDSGAICCVTVSTCCRPPSNRRSHVRSECSLWYPTAVSSGVPPGYPAGHVCWVWWGSSHLTPRAAQDQVSSTHGRFSFKRGHFQLQE